jgi:hypothetical protein
VKKRFQSLPFKCNLQRYSAGRILLRVRSRGGRDALRAWRRHAGSQKQLRYGLQKLLKRWLRLVLDGPFTAWLRYVDSAEVGLYKSNPVQPIA